MTIDLGDNPVGNRPTTAQRNQIRASIGCSQVPFLIGNTEQLVDNSDSFLKNSQSKFAFQVGAVNSLNFNDAAGVSAIVNLNALHDKNTITSINGIEPCLLGLDASNCTGINQSCTLNQGQLYNLNFSGCNNLPSLICTDNALTGLNVAGCTKLTLLHCYFNELTGLNVAGLTGLTTLNCYNNQLANLNATGLTSLTTLDCSENQLTSLNIAGSTGLTSLSCDYNQLTAESVNNILITLSGFGKSNGVAYLGGDQGAYINAAPTGAGISAKNYLTATKGWTVSTNLS